MPRAALDVDLTFTRREVRRLLLRLAAVTLPLAVVWLLGVEVLAAARAYVEGEALWSRAQQDAYTCLVRYASSRNPADYQCFERAIRVPLGDRQAREALDRRPLDLDRARQGFLAGGNHPDDVERMIWFFLIFRREPHVARAVEYWTEGDREIAALIDLGRRLRTAVEGGAPPVVVASIVNGLHEVDERLSPVQVAFSRTIGEGARLVARALQLLVAAGVMLLLFVSWRVGRGVRARLDRSAARLRDSNARKTAILEAALDAVITIDGDGNIVECNAATETLFGRSRDEMVGREMIALLAPAEAHEAHRQGLARTIESGDARVLGRRLELTAQHADGTIFPVELTIVRVPAETPLFTGFVRDISDRRRAEAELRRFADIANNMQLGLYVWQLQDDAARTFRLVFGNHAAAALTRVSAEGLVGHTMEELFPTMMETALPAVCREIVRDGSTRDLGEMTFGTAHPSAGVFAVKAFALPDRCVGMVFEDVSARRRLEEQLSQAQKMETVGRLAGGIAHDFNNILTAILGFAELVGERLDHARMPDGELNEIRRAAERARDLTSQLLAFSRKQILQLRPVDLNALVGQASRLLRRVIGEDIRMDVDLEPAPRTVRADPAQIEQVLLNLAVNARDAMPRGGRLVVQTRLAHVPDSAEDARPGPGWWMRLTVEDSGPGIPDRHLPHIFEPFFTTKPPGQGTGLGLAMVYGVVRQTGGEVQVRTARGKGTSFDIYLPVVEASPADVQRSDVPRAAEGGGRILLVEDDQAVRSLVERILAERGYAVRSAAHPAEALALDAGELGTFDLLLTDVVMPGIGGPELAERLQARAPGLRVLMMSGYTNHSLLPSGALQGVRLLHKPFAPAELVRAVQERLASPP